MFKALKAFVCAGKHDPRELGISFVDREKSREVEEGQSECHVPCFHNVDIRRDFELKDLIGFPGSFGEVRLAVHRASGKEYAVKMMKVQKFLVDVIKSECEIMKNLEHPHLASIVSIFENKKRVYLVMEKYNGGDLFDMIVSKGGRLEDEGNAANVTKQILEGLKYMHDRNIAHCDIKLSNIMLTGETEKPDVKIIDFGVSQYVSEEGLTAEVGSPSFIAPEVLIGSYNLECDLWSLGVVVFIMLMGFNPFNPKAIPALPNRQKICENVLKGFSPETKRGYGAFFPQTIPISDCAKDFISHLLVSDWRHRFSVDEALQHPWINP